MALAMEVFPVPGGPQRTIEGRRSLSMAERSKELGPRRWSCPTTSSRVRGRMRSDKSWWELKGLLADLEGGIESLGRLERGGEGAETSS